MLGLRKLVAGNMPVALAAARCFVTLPPGTEVDLGPVWGLKSGRDRESEDETTFKRPFHFLKTNQLPAWPRTTGMTEVCGPFTDVMGKRRMWDLLETMGPAIDGIKFVGSSPLVVTRSSVVELIEIAHSRFVYDRGPKAVRKYMQECRDLHFDAVELPDACADTLAEQQYLHLLDDLQKANFEAGLKPKPKVGIWHAGGAASNGGFLRERAFDHGSMATAADAILKAKRCFEHGAEQVTVDNLALPGEQSHRWQELVVRRLIEELGLSKVMFEAPHPEAFTWFVKKFGPEVNLHIDFTQVVHLQCLRRGVLHPPDVPLVYTGLPPPGDSDDDSD